jgi:hypothetical protein
LLPNYLNPQASPWFKPKNQLALAQLCIIAITDKGIQIPFTKVPASLTIELHTHANAQKILNIITQLLPPITRNEMDELIKTSFEKYDTKFPNDQ